MDRRGFFLAGKNAAVAEKKFPLPKASVSLNLFPFMFGLPTMDRAGFEIVALTPTPKEGEKAPPAWTSLVPIGIIVLMLYLLLIRPQQKKAKEHSLLLAKLKVGDKVTTSGGIVGTVVSLKDKSIAIRSADAKMEILKSAVAEVAEKGANQSG